MAPGAAASRTESKPLPIESTVRPSDVAETWERASMGERRVRSRVNRWLVAPPFVGRVDDVLELDHAREQAAAGAPQIILISGDAGVGKSRLLNELLGRARAEGATTLVLKKGETELRRVALTLVAGELNLVRL